MLQRATWALLRASVGVGEKTGRCHGPAPARVPRSLLISHLSGTVSPRYSSWACSFRHWAPLPVLQVLLVGEGMTQAEGPVDGV